MPADSHCEKFEIVFEIVCEIAGAKLWQSAGENFFGGWTGLKKVSGRSSNLSFHFSFRFFILEKHSGEFRSAEVQS